MKTIHFAIALLGAALVGLPRPAPAQNSDWRDQREINHADRHFLTRAAEGSTNEVALSRLAVDRAQDPQVREFARWMIRDHHDLNQKVRNLAGRKSIDLNDAIEKGRLDDVDSLARKSGADFDQAYLDAMVKGHKDTIDLFEDAAANSRDPEIASFATQSLPTILDHYRHARALDRREEERNGNAYPAMPVTPFP